MHLLPTGKVILWGDQGDSQLWDPANPSAGFTPATKPYRIFCSGHSLLPDGRLFVAGGHITNDHGLAKGAIFDPSLGTWSTTATSMVQGRWYPTTTTLPNGEMLVVSGADENAAFVLTNRSLIAIGLVLYATYGYRHSRLHTASAVHRV